MGQALGAHALGRLLQHLTGEVDADHPLLRPVARQGEAGADAHFQHAGAGEAVHRLHRAAAAMGGHAAEDHVIHPSPATIGVAHPLGIQDGAGVVTVGGVGADGHSAQIPASPGASLVPTGDRRKTFMTVKGHAGVSRGTFR